MAKDNDELVPKTVFFFGKNKRVCSDNHPYTLNCGKNMKMYIYDRRGCNVDENMQCEVEVAFYSRDFEVSCIVKAKTIQAAVTIAEKRLLAGTNTLIAQVRRLRN